MQQEGTTNLFLLFFEWWYSIVPSRLFSMSKAVVLITVDLFSVKQILPTLFAPWKRDVITTDGLSLQERFQVLAMNLASRVIGFIIKVFVFIAFSVFLLLAVATSLSIFAIWLLYPLVIIALIFLALGIF